MQISRTVFPIISITLILILTKYPASSFAEQSQEPSPVCKASALRSLKRLPTLRYKCRQGVTDYNEAILKWPERVTALKTASVQLAALVDAGWWRANVSDLNVCEFKKRVGPLNDDEKQKYKDDYGLSLLGDNQMRLVILYDPCYQTDYNGSVIFLLSRTGGKVVVSKLFDGYFSRVTNSIGFDYADLNGEKIIELETGNSMPPTLTNYYFAIGPKTHHAVPRKIIMEGAEMSNEISSDMLMSEPEDLGLTKEESELIVIRDHKMAPSFSVYTEDPEGEIESVDKRFKRTIYKWNGRFYSAEK